MKKIFFTLSFVIASGLISAQNNKTKAADKLFDRYEYVEAAEAYLKIVDENDDDLYIESQLAECYYNVFNTSEAVKWYGKIAEQKNDAETYYRYAQMLKAQGNYTESDKQMNKFAALAPKDQRAIEFKSNPNYLQDLKNQSKLFEITPATISSDKSDFGAVMSNTNEVYFSSARNGSRKNASFNEEPFLDVYKAIYNEDGTLSEPTLVSEINTKWHDGPVAISADGNTMFFGSESFNESEFVKDKDKRLKYGKIYLYKATKNGDKWSNIKPLPFNNEAYSLRNPALSADGKTLYFSSDMPGGIGGEDIYKVSVDGDTYGTPENLGNKVNTEGDESFPFITNKDVLYFASNAREGFGGFDIFKIDLAKDNEPLNVGEPVNTEKDDFSFAFNTDKKVAFFSSNRAGVDNIYMATPICGVNGLVLVKNSKTGTVIEGVLVSVLDDQNNVVSTNTTNDQGNAKFGLACEKDYNFNASRSGFENAVASMSKSEGGEEIIEILMDPIKPIITETEVILNPIFFEFNRSNITKQGAEELDRLVDVMNEHPEMVIFAKSHTDSRGGDKYNLNLSDRRAKATVQYIISKGIDKERISGQGFGETEPKVDCKKCTEEEHAQNRRSEFLIVKK
ncbi:OmpA family protein [Flavobacterium okayamense]|uniref:Cell envelope biogenesis protein OmpA n=1 Tax=Flavobacterium okayamense TaxID=2830782 RepID=A0ABN6HTI1_9FLAO|nr:OmpA family protein [Flavobacterium okayamense]BCY27586.1 cell envelope biogenesis protein OmpA [Flavobacterium okayamense]